MLAKAGVLLDLSHFASICPIAKLRVVELHNRVRRVSAPLERQVVLVNCFGVERPLYKLGESPSAPWCELGYGGSDITCAWRVATACGKAGRQCHAKRLGSVKAPTRD